MKTSSRARRIVLAALLGAVRTHAHQLDHPKRDALRITRDRLELTIDEETAPGDPARNLRLLFDRNRDGHLDDEEQQKLLAHLAKSARLHQRIEVDGQPIELTPDRGSPRGERLGDPSSSTALLAVHLVLSAPFPPGSGDWRGRRKLVFTDDAPDSTGHVPVQIRCDGCEIADSNLGIAAHDPRGDQVLGAEVNPAKPLELKLNL